VERDQGAQRLYVQQDANYNVTAITDALGNVRERYALDPYGGSAVVLTASWGQIPASLYSWVYLHQGGRYDGETGLYDFRNRFYDPEKGRWLNLDPLGFDAGDSNLYRYEGNEPTTATDSSGLEDDKTKQMYEALLHLQSKPSLFKKDSKDSPFVAAQGYQSCIMCHGHPYLGWQNIAGSPELINLAPMSQKVVIASTDFKRLDDKYKNGVKGLVQTGLGIAATVGGTLVTIGGNPAGPVAMFVGADMTVSGFVAYTTGGEKQRELLTKRLLVEVYGLSPEEAEGWVTAFGMVGSVPLRGGPAPATSSSGRLFANYPSGRVRDWAVLPGRVFLRGFCARRASFPWCLCYVL
jgi:RHS repeat-associated protein